MRLLVWRLSDQPQAIILQTILENSRYIATPREEWKPLAGALSLAGKSGKNRLNF